MNKYLPETELTLLAKEAQRKYSLPIILVLAVAVQIVSMIPQLFILSPLVLMSQQFMHRVVLNPDLIDHYVSVDTVNLASLFCTVFCIIATIIFCTKIEKRSVRSLGFRGKTPVTEYLLGLVFGAAMFAVVWGICLVTGTVDCRGISTNISPLIAVFFLGFLVQGMSEEVFSRGFMMQSLSIRYAGIVAVVINAVFFAAMHLGNNEVSFLSIFNIFLFGVFASLYMWKRGNIWGIAAFHSAWNFTQGNLLGVRVSGGNFGPSVLETVSDPSGALINGGGFGMEGGLACTLVFVAGIVFFLFMPVRQDSRIAVGEEPAPEPADL
jgi:membrane protease YdiL (CAAX protease family)